MGQKTNPIGLSISQDSRDATHYITDVAQSGLSLPDRDYYLSKDPKQAAVRDQADEDRVRSSCHVGDKTAFEAGKRVVDQPWQARSRTRTPGQLRNPKWLAN